MQALDPASSQTLHVIACFDELVVGNVNTRALLSAAAALTGCPVGHQMSDPPRQMRVDPHGRLLSEVDPSPWARYRVADDHEAWIERVGTPLANDAMVLERLSLALRLRHSRSRAELDVRRELGVALDSSVGTEERVAAAARLGLVRGPSFRVVAAPLFASWTRHPDGPEDVISTPLGTLHVLVVPAAEVDLDGSPLGVGVPTRVEHLDRSFRTALVALRLCDDATGLVDAATYGGLADLLADLPDDVDPPELEPLATVLGHPWGEATVQAIIESGSVRQAARIAGVHHSTLRARIDAIELALGFDPLDGYGRTRLGVAWLLWRMRRSRALDLPPAQVARDQSRS